MTLPFPDVERLAQLANRAFELDLATRDQSAAELLRHVIREVFPGRLALTSSFGSESAVLLHMVSRIDPALPVIFLDTGRLFGETLRYRAQLVDALGLSDVRDVGPDPHQVAALDQDLMLYRRDPDLCCFIRKVAPLDRALKGFDGWITGRKSHQAESRDGLRRVESDGRRIKINPLADWSQDDIDAYFDAHDLPRHPLEADGYLSIGCLPCTDRVAPGEDARAGRWRGFDKTECGIHEGPSHAG